MATVLAVDAAPSRTSTSVPRAWSGRRARAAALEGFRVGVAAHADRKPLPQPGDPSFGLLAAFLPQGFRERSELLRLISGNAGEPSPLQWDAFHHRLVMAGMAPHDIETVCASPDWWWGAPTDPGLVPLAFNYDNGKLEEADESSGRALPSLRAADGKSTTFQVDASSGELWAHFRQPGDLDEVDLTRTPATARILCFTLLKMLGARDGLGLPKRFPSSPALNALSELHPSEVADSAVPLASVQPFEPMVGNRGFFEVLHWEPTPGGPGERVEFLRGHPPERPSIGQFLTPAQHAQVLFGDRHLLRVNIVDSHGESSGFRPLTPELAARYIPPLRAAQLKRALESERAPGTTWLLQELLFLGLEARRVATSRVHPVIS